MYQRLFVEFSCDLHKIPSLSLLSNLSSVVHTKDESLQDELRVVQTCGMTLASANMLCHLFAMWLQLQMIGRSLK